MGEGRTDEGAITDLILQSYRAHPGTRHIDAGQFPDRALAIALLKNLRDLLFPGYFGGIVLTEQNLAQRTRELVGAVVKDMAELIGQALRYQAQTEGTGGEADAAERAAAATDAFLQSVPELRRLLATDVQAAFDGDPAAINTDETVFTYPGILAIFTHRVAHRLVDLCVPLVPRVMSEWVHHKTGIDIHPGARIGESFFLDHGTGIVIGQTTDIGDRVKLYQGVTLGAMSFPRDAEGRLIRDAKRHPSIGDDVTVYANATILGGATAVGKGCIIGASVFLTKSVPPGHFVTLKGQELRYRSAEVHDRLVTPRSDDAPAPDVEF